MRPRPTDVSLGGLPTDVPHPRRWLAWLVGLAVLAAVVIIVTRISEPRDFVRLVERAEPWWLAVAFVLQAGTYVAQAQVWRTVGRAASQPLAQRPAVLIALAKLFFDQTLPSGGISGAVLVTSALGHRGWPQPAVAATVIIELASYYLGYAVALGVAIAIAAAAGHLGTVVVIPAVVFIAFALAAAVGALVLSRVHHLPALPGLARANRWLTSADRRLTGDIRLVARAVGWQLAVVALDGTTMWTVLRAIGVDAPIAGVYASFMIASLARTLSIVPGGLGVFEGVGVLALAQLGVDHAAALSAALLFRGLSYWLPMIPGFIASRRLQRGARATT